MLTYDSKILTTRAQRLGENARYVFNPCILGCFGHYGPVITIERQTDKLQIT
jgi:hypothetical protein